MARTPVQAFAVILALGGLLSMIALTSVHGQLLPSSCPTGFANFGDTLTDTGNALDAFPFTFDAENSPYGETFFGAPAKRFCNGRLVPDFFSQAFRVPLLDAYFSVASFNYKSGINFASAGATAVFNPTALSPFSLTPFQTGQFIRFQESVIAGQAQLGCLNFNLELPSLILQNPFSTWLYTIAAGSFDLLPLIQNGATLAYANNVLVPAVVNAIAEAINTLYQRGARKFLIFGVPAGGCSTLAVMFQPNATKDGLGCVVDLNSVVQNFNSQLLSKIIYLRSVLTGSAIAFFDYYGATIEILTHPSTYGFNPALIRTVCCGAPGVGTLNYNPAVTCGHPGSNNCANPDSYINWDGIHFTESFYRTIARFALNGVFTDGGTNYTASCNLDFSKFGSGITFKQAYPLQTCNNLYT